MQHVVEYNKIALEVFNAVVAGTTIGAVNDLHTEVNGACGVNFTSCALQDYNNEHPSIPGAAFLGIKTAQTIAPFLNPRRKDEKRTAVSRWKTDEISGRGRSRSRAEARTFVEHLRSQAGVAPLSGKEAAAASVDHSRVYVTAFGADPTGKTDSTQQVRFMPLLLTFPHLF